MREQKTGCDHGGSERTPQNPGNKPQRNLHHRQSKQMSYHGSHPQIFGPPMTRSHTVRPRTDSNHTL